VSSTVFGSSPKRAATMWTGTPSVSASIAAVWRSTCRLPEGMPGKPKMTLVDWRDFAREKGLVNPGLSLGVAGEQVQVRCGACGHLLLQRQRRPAEDPTMLARIQLLGYPHGQAIARELGQFKCPGCGYSWEDARELFPGVWD
jgi:hypothetical protein